MPIDIACPNFSLDRTIEVRRAELGAVHRSVRSDARGGGKGVNVARALRGFGVDARVTGILGGRTGSAVAGLLDDEGLDVDAIRIDGETRSCLTVVASDCVTVFNEDGPSLGRGSWERYEDLAVERMRPGAVFVCSGSFPPGAPDDAAARLLRRAREGERKIVLDASRAHLERALETEPDLIKPNLHEALALLTGQRDESVESGPDALRLAAEAAAALRNRGPRNVVVSAGAAGAGLATSSGTETVAAPAVELRNPVGAGDCMVAAFALALERRGQVDRDALRYAVAAGSAGCETFAAGVVEVARVEELVKTIA